MELKDTRSGFGDALNELGYENKNVLALCADLTPSLKMTKFKSNFPDRFFQIGIAEANMIGISAGLAIGGKIPFVGSFAPFVTGRVYDQIRQSIAYSKKNVKICASHAGLTLGEDGATHQMLEDIGLMKMLPNMIVVVPCDYNQTFLATKEISKIDSPVYLRFGRPKVPNFTKLDNNFEIGKGILLKEGSDVTIIATGHMVWKALEASNELMKTGVNAEVINIHTIKPLDNDIILQSVSKTKRVVVAEEHMMNGGLGDSVAQLLSKKLPTFIEYVSVDDTFGESGTPDELMSKYKLDVVDVVLASKRILNNEF